MRAVRTGGFSSAQTRWKWGSKPQHAMDADTASQLARVALAALKTTLAPDGAQANDDVLALRDASNRWVPPELGNLLPLSDTQTGADLAQAPGLPVALLVALPVGLRLGCLIHALLTAGAIRARGLTRAGWVANRVNPDMLAHAGHIVFLQQQQQRPLKV